MTGNVAAIDRGTARRLRRLFGEAISFTREDRICYSFDATDLRFLPEAVAWPGDAAQVAGAVGIAAESGVPVVARGAGSGYTGGSLPLSGGLVLSFERMNRVLLVDAKRKVAVVEPGVVNDDLRARVEAVGLTYPPDPASLRVSTIGGNVAESAGGPRTVLHGTTRDYVAGLEMVTAEGDIARTGVLSGSRHGWDGGPLFVGSEGTLAVLTRVALRLTELAESFATLWAEFPSLGHAASAVAQLTATGLPLSVLEILDGDTYACAHEYVLGAAPADSAEGALLIELEGSAREVTEGVATVSDLVRSNGATGVREAVGEKEREEIWEIRRSISPAIARLGEVKINEDIAVPRSAIPAFVGEMRRISSEAGLPILAFGHAGDGNLHVNIMLKRAGAGELERARRAVSGLFAVAVEMGGALSGEHGIGITKAEHLATELSPVSLDLTARLKGALDGRGILNPGKILADRPNPWWDPPGGNEDGCDRC
ncbi:MAG: FAD-binding protein [Candidatus Eisenbacteria bacterium]|nr:FAD-binding protein [Candidatus Eisenbacteria bacterium]